LSAAEGVDQRILAYVFEMRGRVEMTDTIFPKAQEFFLKAIDLYSDPAFQTGIRMNLAYCAFFLEQVDQAVELAGLAWQAIQRLPADIQTNLWPVYKGLRMTILASTQSEIKEPPAGANEKAVPTSFLSLVDELAHQADYWISIGKYGQALTALRQLEPWLHSDEWPLLRAQVWDDIVCARIGLKQYELALQALEFEEDCLKDYPDKAALWAKLWQWRAICEAETGRRAEACIHLQKSLDCWMRVPDSEKNQSHVRKMIKDNSC